MSLTWGSGRMASSALRTGPRLMALGALLAEVAGCLLAERGVLGPQPGDFLACGVQAGAERVGAGALAGRRAGFLGWFTAQAADQVADAGVAVEPGPGDAGRGCDGA